MFYLMDRVKIALAKNPELVYDGWLTIKSLETGCFRDKPENYIFLNHEEKEKVVNFLREKNKNEFYKNEEQIQYAVSRMAALEESNNELYNSYFLKHLLECDDQYVSNGVLILSAILCGFDIYTCDHINIEIGISESSIKKYAFLTNKNIKDAKINLIVDRDN